MSNRVKFSLDTDAAGNVILQGMVKPIIRRSGQAILARAMSMASKISSDPPTFTIEDDIGIIRKGTRAITTITAPYDNPREEYVARQALSKAKDAGRLK